MRRVRCKACGKLVQDFEDVKRHHMSRHAAGTYARPNVDTDAAFEVSPDESLRTMTVFGLNVAPEEACSLFEGNANDNHREDPQDAGK